MYQELTVETGEAYLTFLEFDFPDIDDVIPFGPMGGLFSKTAGGTT